jgi:hypothetical protein
MPWKEAANFYGGADSFLFQLDPKLAVYRPEGLERNFAYLHTSNRSTLMPNASQDLPSGLGFGGSIDQPRLYMPESMEHCKAGFLDKTYRPGELLPEDALEKFEIAIVEVWAVGGDKVIVSAMDNQAEYRKRHEEYLQEARKVHDKTPFVKDLESGRFMIVAQPSRPTMQNPHCSAVVYSLQP